MADFYLREISSKDLIALNKWRNDPEVIDQLGAAFRYIDLSVDEGWLNNYFSSRSTNIRLAICRKDKDLIIGVAYVLSVDWVFRSCEFAILIGDSEFRGKGVGSFALKKTLNHIFNNMNLNRVELTVLEDNKAAIALYKKFKFKEEGLLREVVYKNGEYKNMILMSLLKRDLT